MYRYMANLGTNKLIDIKILTLLDEGELNSLCRTNRRFANLCNLEELWDDRIKYWYPEFYDPILKHKYGKIDKNRSSWRRYYQTLKNVTTWLELFEIEKAQLPPWPGPVSARSPIYAILKNAIIDPINEIRFRVDSVRPDERYLSVGHLGAPIELAAKRGWIDTMQYLIYFIKENNKIVSAPTLKKRIIQGAVDGDNPSSIQFLVNSPDLNFRNISLPSIITKAAEKNSINVLRWLFENMSDEIISPNGRYQATLNSALAKAINSNAHEAMSFLIEMGAVDPYFG
jgi:hypothetical protein